MPNKFTPVFLFVCVISYAQLSVRNDAFVFISDEVVFVENDVNLGEADSKIYLRNDGQIIQGSGITGNSGEGFLSVYQEGTVNEYAYNYWCSPIGTSDITTSNNPFGISLLNDVVNLTDSNPATHIHSSTYNSTSTPLNIEPFWIWKYIIGNSYADWIHVQDNTTINAGEGFTMKGTIGGNQKYDFRGKPNNGEIAVDVLYNYHTLVGNPYPSALDAYKYIHDPENVAVINGTLYYWEQDATVNSHYLADYQGGYATYNIDINEVETVVAAPFNTYNQDGTINVGGPARPFGKTPKRYIPIGQGFMVEGSLGAILGGNVKTKNSHRVFVKESSADSEFFKSTNTKNKSKSTLTTNDGFSLVPNDYKRFRLNIDFNNTYTRQLVETFNILATDGFDYGMESKINTNDILKSDAHWLIGNDSYTVEALSFSESLKIPLVIKAAQNIPLRIRIADIQNFENTSNIYLHDIENETYVDLKTQDFNINLEAGNYTNRFEITFIKNTLNNNTETISNFNVFQNNDLSELTISNPNSESMISFKLYDVSGKLVLNKALNSNETKYSYSTKSLSDGIYIAKVNSKNHQIFSKKIIVLHKK